MEDLKNQFAKFVTDKTPAGVDAAWYVLQRKLSAYFERRKDAKLFQDEIYKWRLLSHYVGVVFDNAEKLNAWLQDKDNNLLSSRSFGSTYDGMIRGERNSPSLIKDGFQLFSSIDNYQLIRENPLFQWKNQKGEEKTITDRDIATYLFLQNPLQYMPYPSDVFAKAAKDIGLNNMAMPRWMEFGKYVILPLLAEKFNVTPIVDVDAIRILDIERDFTDIQTGKYLCMLDVQDFVFLGWRQQNEVQMERNYFTMLMRKGKSGNNDPSILRSFIEKKKIIGCGDKDSTNGFGVFTTLQKGDIVAVRAAGKSLALVEVLSNETQEYKSDEEFTQFDWLVCSKTVKVLLFRQLKKLHSLSLRSHVKRNTFSCRSNKLV